MSNLDFQVRAINNTLAKLPKHMQKTKRRVELAAGRAMIKAIRNGTPVSKNSVTSGDLRKSVGRITKLRKAIYTYIGIRSGSGNRKSGYYAKYLEYGKAKQPARPFFKKAAAAGVSAARAILENGTKFGLKEFELQNKK